MNAPNSKKNIDDPLPVPTMRDVLSPLFRHRRLVIGTFCALFAFSILVRVAMGFALLRGEDAGCR